MGEHQLAVVLCQAAVGEAVWGGDLDRHGVGFSVQRLGDPDRQLHLLDGVLGEVGKGMSLTGDKVNIALLKSVSPDEQSVFHATLDGLPTQIHLPQLRLGHDEVANLDAVDALNAVLFEALEHGRRAESHQVELAHWH